jgi:hypothetical protein
MFPAEDALNIGSKTAIAVSWNSDHLILCGIRSTNYCKVHNITAFLEGFICCTVIKNNYIR